VYAHSDDPQQRAINRIFVLEAVLRGWTMQHPEAVIALEDYALGLGVPLEPGVMRLADVGLVDERVEELRAAMWEAVR